MTAVPGAGAGASETLRLTRALLEVDTIDPPGNESRAAAIVAGVLSRERIEYVTYDIAPGRTNLVARLPGNRTRQALAFSAHFDTIGVDLERWSRDPFGAEIADGRLYGRGATDMKGGMAAMTMAMVEMKRQGAALQGDLLLTFSAAENSNALGAKRLVADGHFDNVGALLVSEPTSMTVIVSEKGALWLRATARGDYAHSAFSEDRTGDRGNAIVRLARFLDRAHDVVLAAPRHRHLKPPTVNVGLVRGGLSTPLIPATASADFDVRLVPGLEPRAVIDAFRALAGEHVEVELLDVKPPVDTPDDHPFVQLCLDACRRVTGLEGGPGGVAYYSDGAVIAPVLGIPMVIIGPGEIGMSGAIDEYVEIAKLEASTAVFRSVAEKYLA